MSVLQVKKLNNDKAFMFFSCNIDRETKAHIMSVIGVSVSQCYEKYLGFPALVGCSKVSTFIGIKGKYGKESTDGRKIFCHKQGGRSC
jgi:hypothetical protein